MPTYAIADKVPPECDYITAGAEYECENVTEFGFDFKDNDGDLLRCSWVCSAQINGGSWRRVDK